MLYAVPWNPILKYRAKQVAIQSYPEQAEFYIKLAEVYKRNGEKGLAKETRKKGYEITGDNRLKESVGNQNKGATAEVYQENSHENISHTTEPEPEPIPEPTQTPEPEP